MKATVIKYISYLALLATTSGVDGTTLDWSGKAGALFTEVDEQCRELGRPGICSTASTIVEDLLVHVCPADGDPCTDNVCYTSYVRPCCANTTGKCISKTEVFVRNRVVTVLFYDLATRPAEPVYCMRFEPKVNVCEPCDELDCQRLQECKEYALNETTCMEGFDPDASDGRCCDCDFTDVPRPGKSYYKEMVGNLITCPPFCRENCALIRDRKKGCFSCAPGYVDPPECCDCDIYDNFFYDPVDDTCKQNCTNRTGIANFECSKNKSDTPCICKKGYTGAPGCCECDEGFVREDGKCEESCDPVQDIYFLLDVSSSFSETTFCKLNLGLQLLIAAINPTEISNTKIAGFLFGEYSHGPAPKIFNKTTPCNKIVKNILPRVTQEMGEDSKCRDSTYPSNRNPLKNPSTREYPSVCKDGTYPLPGLEEIRDLANSDNDKTRKRASVIFTDGVATGTDKQVSDLMKELENVGVTTVIAAGIPDATEEDLRRFSSSNNLTVLGSTPVKLVRQVADKLQEGHILCEGQVDKIKAALDDKGNDLAKYCYCVAGFCEPTLPTCGDSSLTFSGSKRNADIESNMKTELEEEILEAVEEVMKHLTDE